MDNYIKCLEIKRKGDNFQLFFSIIFGNTEYTADQFREIINNKETILDSGVAPLLADFTDFFKVVGNIKIKLINNERFINFSQINTIERIAMANNFKLKIDKDILRIKNITSKNFNNNDKLFYEIENLKLRDYQVHGANWLIALKELNESSILADDMGLGKTIMSLVFINKMLKDDSKTKILIVCPAAVIYNWEKEIKKFLKKIKYTIFKSELRDLYFLNPDGIQVLIGSYQGITTSQNNFETLDFDVGIFDEAQNLKNYRAKSYKALDKLNIKHRILLSGTPIENNIEELWSLVNFTSKNHFESLKSFKNKFTQEVVLDSESDEVLQLRTNISHIILRRNKSDVLHELPEKILLERRSNMTIEQIETTKEVLKTNLKPIVKFNMLIQVASHPCLIKKNLSEDIKLSSKLSILEDLISSRAVNSKNTIIFTRFLKTQEIINNLAKKHYKFVKIINGGTELSERESIIDKSKESIDPCCLILSYKASAVGINLQHFDIVFHYDKWWNPQLEKQAEDRAYRMGRKGDVTVYSLYSEGSIDDHIERMHIKKNKIVENIIGDNIGDEQSNTNIEEILMSYEDSFRKEYL